MLHFCRIIFRTSVVRRRRLLLLLLQLNSAAAKFIKKFHERFFSRIYFLGRLVRLCILQALSQKISPIGSGFA